MRKLSLFLVFAASLVCQSSTYRVTHSYPLGGEGSWDYVVPDPPHHRLFIARQNRVMVVDEDSGKLLGEVTGIDGAHGTAIAESTGHGFATEGNGKSVAMFDLKTYKTLGRIPAAEDADAIVYDAPSNRVFTLNGDAHSSTVIDPKAGRLIGNIPLGGKPEYGVSAGDGKVYANLTDTAEVVEIDAAQAVVTRRWSTAPCKNPVSMAIDTAHHRLFSGCRSGVMAVSDYQAGKVVATVPIGQGVDGAAYDPAAGDAFASNADGTLTVIHQDSPDRYRVAQTIETPRYSRNMGLDPTNHRIFVASAKFGEAPAGGRGRPPVLPGTFSVLVIERAPAAARLELGPLAPAAAGFQSVFPVDKKTLGIHGANPYFNLTPGYRLEYRDGNTSDIVTVLNETKTIDGVETRVVEDREMKNGAPVEVTRDYYAIDSATNDVYYFGEDVDVYKNGKVVGHEGAWLSGVNGAKFGLMMPGTPQKGQKFYQEQAPAGMDRAEILALDEKVTTPAGTFDHCLHVVETSDLEKGMRDHKWYRAGIGPVKDGKLLLVAHGTK